MKLVKARLFPGIEDTLNPPSIQTTPLDSALVTLKTLKVNTVTKSALRRVLVKSQVSLSRLETHLLIKHLASQSS